MSVQLPLEIGLSAPPHSFANYVPGDNQAVIQALQQVIRGEGQTSLYLWGETGTGKTHLLHAACQEVAMRGGTPGYLPLSDIRHYPTEAVEGLDTLDLVCLDDLHSIAGLEHWEHAVFSLFNRLRETNIPLLISANAVPNALHLGLKDLVSRLSWGGVFALQGLGVEARKQALHIHAHGLGLELSEVALNYLIRHCPSDMKSLINWLDYLDHASLAAKRRITVPFIRSLLKNEAAGDI